MQNLSNVVVARGASWIPHRWPVSRIWSLALLLWAALPVSAASAHLLFVDLRTDYLPGTDFVGVRTRLLPDSVDERPQTESFVVNPMTDTSGGFRCAGFDDIEGGDYTLETTLFDAQGAVTAYQTTRLFLGDNYAVLIVAHRPQVNAIKSWALSVDADGDGRIGPGDHLRYTVLMAPTGTRNLQEPWEGELVFDDTPGVGTRLIPGSVTTTHGAVVTGNGAADSKVVVHLGYQANNEVSSVTFDVVIAPAVSNQGQVTFETHTESGRDYRLVLPTDDPALPGDWDPTTTPLTAVSCPGGQEGPCERALEACQDSLWSCEEDRAECAGAQDALDICERERQETEVSLAGLVGDTDGDGVMNVRDDCAGTALGAAVDAAGCSLAQFCSLQQVMTATGVASCRARDWRDDELLTLSPRDCAPKRNVCVPR